ncbi:MAG: AarF/ABC1/UbiB kinase family protein [Pseudomonadota bacterium]
MAGQTSEAKARAIPVGRAARAARLGGVGLSIAGHVAADGARELLRGKSPNLRGLVLTPGNIQRITNELARMRGAAMKVGQLVSLDAGDVLPQELATIISRLRADADFMPPKQLRNVLDREWGSGWIRRFSRFNVRPIAAASIGQVHEAVGHDGRHMAIKVQYPGVRESIDSDVSNVGALIGMSGIVPKGLDLAPLLKEAKRQLREEADYAREARELQRFGDWLQEDSRFAVPGFVEEFSTPSVLAMDFLAGEPVEGLDQVDQAERNVVMTALFDLTLKELFEIGHMQSDPNFANYRYNRDTKRVLLLDFGAARAVPRATREAYRAIARAVLNGNRHAIDEGCLSLGIYASDTAQIHKAAILDLIDKGATGITASGSFDFGDAALRRQLADEGMRLAEDQNFLHIPPFDTLYVQRKLAGMFLLASRLQAEVNLRATLAPWL